MAAEQFEAIVAEVEEALCSGSFELPAFPDVALKIRDLIDDPNVSADQLVKLLSADPVISAHIIKAANTAGNAAGGARVETIRAAISRLGYRMLYNLVVTVTFGKVFKAITPSIDRKMKQLWERSRTVAAHSYVIALRLRHLKPEQAMLAGMVHNLGAMALCIYADKLHPQLEPDTLERLLRLFSSKVSIKLLDKWNFPQEIVEVVAGYENLQRQTADAQPDLTDVVTIAIMQSSGSGKFAAWQNVAAVARLGCTPESCINFASVHAEELNAAFAMLELPTRAFTPSPAPEAVKKVVPPPAPQATVKSGGILGSLLKIFK